MEKEEFLALAASRYDALRELNKGKVDFYDLEALLTDKKRIVNKTPHFQFVYEGYFETTKTTSP